MRTATFGTSKRRVATWPMTMFVLSPFVATTQASAPWIPAISRMSRSIPCPTVN
jgi:hypothetical protein